MPASLETSHNYFFAAKAPDLEVPLRIPSGDEVIPVESGQQETSHDLFLGSLEKSIKTRLDRGRARLPGDESRLIFVDPPNIIQRVMIFRPAKNQL